MHKDVAVKAGWKRRQLGELAELRGRIGWRGLTAKEYTEKGPLFLSVHSLNYGDYVDFRDAFHISEERYTESPEIMLQENDVLICKDGAGIGKLGIIGELPDRATINSSLLLIRSGIDILPKFLYRCLSSPYFQEIVNSRLNGATTPHLYQRDITEFPVVLPPLAEQQRVVAILDQAFEGIAKARANAEQNLQNARALFESHLQSVFTQRGNGWVQTRLGEVCDVIGGGTPSKANESYFKGDIFWATVRDMKNEFLEDTEFKITTEAVKNSSTKIIPKGNVVIATRVGLGKVCLLKNDTAINQDLRGIIPQRANTVNVDFLFYWFKSNSTKIVEEGTGATVQGVKLPFIKSLPINLPQFSEQTKIAASLIRFTKETQRLEALCQRKIALLDELKKSLLQQAFAGEL